MSIEPASPSLLSYDFRLLSGVATLSLKNMSKNFYQNRVFGDFGLIEILLRGCKRVEVEAKVFLFNTLITVHTFRFGFAKIQTFEISLYRFVPFCVVFVCNWLMLNYRFADYETTRLQVATVLLVVLLSGVAKRSQFTVVPQFRLPTC